MNFYRQNGCFNGLLSSYVCIVDPTGSVHEEYVRITSYMPIAGISIKLIGSKSMRTSGSLSLDSRRHNSNSQFHRVLAIPTVASSQKSIAINRLVDTYRGENKYGLRRIMCAKAGHESQICLR